MAAEVLSDQQTVPRDLVHRSSIHEVFLTDSRELDGAGTFVVGAQWPRRHIMSDGGSREEVADALLVESIRQAGLYLPHRYFGVPLDFVFVAAQLGFEWLHPERPTFGDGPLRVEARCRLHESTSPRPARRSFKLTTKIYVAGQASASGSGELTCLSPDLYARVRGARRAQVAPETPPAADPATVGRTRRDQVALRMLTIDAERGWLNAEVAVDLHHPFFFDHQYDHLPGPLLIEAAEQAALALCSTGIVSGIDAQFATYADPHAAVDVTATAPDGAGQVTITMTQLGSLVAGFAVCLRQTPALGRRGVAVAGDGSRRSST
jgi:hypothetical protein